MTNLNTELDAKFNTGADSSTLTFMEKMLLSNTQKVCVAVRDEKAEYAKIKVEIGQHDVVQHNIHLRYLAEIRTGYKLAKITDVEDGKTVADYE